MLVFDVVASYFWPFAWLWLCTDVVLQLLYEICVRKVPFSDGKVSVLQARKVRDVDGEKRKK